jgi:DNA-binding MarR family transcriptional regulator
LKRISNMTPTSSTPDRELTATRDILLSSGSDHALRTLLYNLFTIGTRMEEVRRYLGACIGISGPQFSLLMAIQELQGANGVSVGKIAAYLHVAGTFVTAESAKLARKDYIEKRANPRDRRVSLLRVRPAGTRAIERLLPDLRNINDTFFELESREGFESLCRAADRMVEGSRRVLSLIHSVEQAVSPAGTFTA